MPFLHSAPCQVVLHGADYFDCSSYHSICATSRDLNSSATGPEAQGQNIKRRRSYQTQEGMNNIVGMAADLAFNNVIHEWWTPADPLCCSKLCSFGGRTGLWTPRKEFYHNSRALWWLNSRTQSHGFYSKQVTLTHWMQNKNRKVYVVCSEVCGEAVKRTLAIIGLAHGFENPHGSENPPYIIIGVDKLVPPMDDDHSDSSSSSGSYYYG
jgi:hypothetical protein